MYETFSRLSLHVRQTHSTIISQETRKLYVIQGSTSANSGQKPNAMGGEISGCRKPPFQMRIALKSRQSAEDPEETWVELNDAEYGEDLAASEDEQEAGTNAVVHEMACASGITEGAPETENEANGDEMEQSGNLNWACQNDEETEHKDDDKNDLFSENNVAFHQERWSEGTSENMARHALNQECGKMHGATRQMAVRGKHAGFGFCRGIAQRRSVHEFSLPADVFNIQTIQHILGNSESHPHPCRGAAYPAISSVSSLEACGVSDHEYFSSSSQDSGTEEEPSWEQPVSSFQKSQRTNDRTVTFGYTTNVSVQGTECRADRLPLGTNRTCPTDCQVPPVTKTYTVRCHHQTKMSMKLIPVAPCEVARLTDVEIATGSLKMVRIGMGSASRDGITSTVWSKD